MALVLAGFAGARVRPSSKCEYLAISLGQRNLHHQAIILSTLRLYLEKADLIVKMAAIEAEAIEATGNILFGHTMQVAQELQSITKQEYIYFGKFHLAVETGHAVRDDSADVQLASI